MEPNNDSPKPLPPTPEEIAAELAEFNRLVAERTAKVIVMWRVLGDTYRVGILPPISVGINRATISVCGEKLGRDIMGNETWGPHFADATWMSVGLARALLQTHSHINVPVTVDLGTIDPTT